MAAARREYEALLIENAARGKGGRPRKQSRTPVKDVDDIDDAEDSEDEGPEE